VGTSPSSAVLWRSTSSLDLLLLLPVVVAAAAVAAAAAAVVVAALAALEAHVVWEPSSGLPSGLLQLAKQHRGVHPRWSVTRRQQSAHSQAVTRGRRQNSPSCSGDEAAACMVFGHGAHRSKLATKPNRGVSSPRVPAAAAAAANAPGTKPT
jgi:hypothetical protein